MNWSEQAQAMMTAWTETQKKLWEGWTAAPRPAAGGEGPWADWMAHWQAAAREALDRWPGGAYGVPKEVAERLVGAEQTFLRFLDLATGMFQEAAPKLQAGADWTSLLRAYVDQMKRELTRTPAPWFSPEAAAAAARDLPELWKLFLAQYQDLGAPWAQSLREARGHVADVLGGDRRASIKMYNLFMDTFESTLGKFVAAPAIGYTREVQEKVTRAFETWVDVRRAEVAFQTELVNTGIRTLEAMVRELAAKGERGETVTSYRQLFDLWVATAEETFAEAASQPSFAAAQGSLVNAAMHYRIRERELAEEFVKALHLPTRRELDDAYRHLYDLRQQVKSLKRDVAALRTTAATPPVPPAPPPRKPRSRKQSKAAPAAATSPSGKVAPAAAATPPQPDEEG